MPEAADVARNLQQLTTDSPEQLLLSEAGHTLEAIISGQFKLQPLEETAQQLGNPSSWYSPGQEVHAELACQGPQVSPGGSTTVECFPISPTPDPTTLVNIVSHLRHRYRKPHHDAASESGILTDPLVAQYPTPTLPAENQHAVLHDPSTFQSAQDACQTGWMDADDGSTANATGGPYPCPTTSQYGGTIPPQVGNFLSNVLCCLTDAAVECCKEHRLAAGIEWRRRMCRSCSPLQLQPGLWNRAGLVPRGQFMSACPTMVLPIDGSCLVWSHRLLSCWEQ